MYSHSPKARENGNKRRPYEPQGSRNYMFGFVETPLLDDLSVPLTTVFLLPNTTVHLQQRCDAKNNVIIYYFLPPKLGSMVPKTPQRRQHCSESDGHGAECLHGQHFLK